MYGIGNCRNVLTLCQHNEQDPRHDPVRRAHRIQQSRNPRRTRSSPLYSPLNSDLAQFSAAQDQARKDVTQATADAREARRERDEAVNALHASRLEEQAWKQEAGVWKAAVRNVSYVSHVHHLTLSHSRQIKLS